MYSAVCNQSSNLFHILGNITTIFSILGRVQGCKCIIYAMFIVNNISIGTNFSVFVVDDMKL